MAAESRNLSGDRGGLEGLPMTLMITMVVLAITVPLIMGSFMAYDRGRVETQLAAELDNFIAMVQLVYMSGPGNSAVIGFDAVSGSMARVEYVTFGDEPGGRMSSAIRYCLAGQQERALAVVSPNVPMFSQELTELSIASGAHSILAECVVGQDGLAGIRLGILG